MAHYIDKDALVTKIERRIKINKECMLGLRNLDYYKGKVDALKDTLSSLNTYEVKEVDFEKELDRIWFDNKLGDYFDNNALDFAHIRTLCKHFFERGIAVSNKAQKGEK